MKINISLILIITVTTISCSTFYTPIDKLRMRGLNTIETETQEDIRGNIESKNLLIYKDKASLIYDDEFILLTKSNRANNDSTKHYRFEYRYRGQSWKYIESLDIKTDDKVWTLYDQNPARDVVDGTGGQVLEICFFSIDQEGLNRLRKADTITLQWYTEPHKLSQTTINGIKDFLN